ncbi:MAG: beta-propeller fold lactonase family protein [Ferruginibacter sp.]
MKKNKLLRSAIAMAILFSIASCNKKTDTMPAQVSSPSPTLLEMIAEGGSNPDEAAIGENTVNLSGAKRPDGESGDAHFLYTETNAGAKNEIMKFKVLGNGHLQFEGVTASGGNGTGKGLGSQGALTMSKNHEWLFAVNAGSNSVSTFKINKDGTITLAHTEITRGLTPVSVTVHDNLLYVLNRGSDNIHGFRIGAGGKLSHIDNSTQALSGKAVDAPQIAFSPSGERIMVTEKATNIISTYKVNNDGSISSGVFTPSVGSTPFGFDFSRDRFMIVTNAAGGAPGAGSATSYMMKSNGMPATVNGAIPNGQAAPCWMAITKFGRFGFATNTGSNNISSYYVSTNGTLHLVQAIAGKSGMAPTDVIVSANNYFVYAITANSNTIDGFKREVLGGLKSNGSTGGIPITATGLVTY